MLLVIITIALVATTYTWIRSITDEAQNETGGIVTHQFDVMGANLKVDVFGDCRIYLRNTGTKDIPIETIGIYGAEVPSESYKPLIHTPPNGTLEKGNVQEINFSGGGLPTNRKHKVLVKIYGKTMDYGYMVCTGPAACSWQNYGCEEGSCGPLEMNQTCGPEDCEGGICTKGESQCVLGLCGGPLMVNITEPLNDSTHYVNIPIDFQGVATGGIGAYSFLWEFGNGDTNNSGLAVVSYSYPAIGDYTVNLTVTDGVPDTAWDSIDIHIVNPPAPVAFSCYINETGGCGSGETGILALSAEENAHAELDTEGNYNQFLCCANVSTVATTTGTGDCDTLGVGFTGLITLSGDTNAQVEKYNYTKILPTDPDGFPYKKNVCVELVGGESFTCMYTDYAGCDGLPGWDIIYTISNNTNAHIGNETAYQDLVRCCEK